MGMKHQSGLDARQLMQMLGRALDGEEQQWKPLLLSTDGPVSKYTYHVISASLNT